jgi:predicted Zn-dependent protease
VTEALEAGACSVSVTAARYYAVQLLAIRLEQGRMGELEQPAREFVQAYPAISAWRVGLARLLLEVGRASRTAEELGLEAIARWAAKLHRK